MTSEHSKRRDAHPWAWLLACALAGCIPDPGEHFTCFTDDQCGAGSCESSGFCSFTDSDCASGRRYGDLAGDGLANTCHDGSSTNYVGNGGFEVDLTGWFSESATLKRVEIGHSYDHGCEVCGEAGNTTFILSDNPSWVTNPVQGETFRADAWVRMRPGERGQKVTITLREGEQMGEQTTSELTLDDTWQRVSVPHVVMASGPLLDFYLAVEDASPGACVIVDDIAIYRVR